MSAAVAAVVLWDLPALFARGLREALTQAGCAPVVIADGGARPVLPAPVPDRATVVIAPAQTLAGWEERCVIDATAVAVVAVVVAAAAAALVVVPDHVAAAVADTPAMTGAPVLGEDERCWLRWLAGGKTVTSLAVAACYSEREMYRLLRPAPAWAPADAPRRCWPHSDADCSTTETTPAPATSPQRHTLARGPAPSPSTLLTVAFTAGDVTELHALPNRKHPTLLQPARASGIHPRRPPCCPPDTRAGRAPIGLDARFCSVV